MRRPHPGSSVLYRTVRIVETINIFAFITVLLTAALFVIGNFQLFQDSSLLMLLRVLSTSGLICMASATFYVVFLGVWMVRRRHLMLLRGLYGVVAIAIGAAGALGAGLLQSLVGSA